MGEKKAKMLVTSIFSFSDGVSVSVFFSFKIWVLYKEASDFKERVTLNKK